MRRTAETELLDSPTPNLVSSPELAENLTDIARLNRLMGTTRLLCQSALELIPPEAKSCTVLDLGTGAADWPDAVLRFATQRRPGMQLRVIAADLHLPILRYARQQSPDLELLGADGMHLPFRSGTIDVTVCAQTVHHLAPDEVIMLLREMARVSRYGFVLFDLTRSPLAVWALRLLTLLISRNRLTRHDGPLSVKRAYRPNEIQALVVRAGLQPAAFQFRQIRPFRWLCVYRPSH